jgi:hypothetical protein
VVSYEKNQVSQIAIKEAKGRKIIEVLIEKLSNFNLTEKRMKIFRNGFFEIFALKNFRTKQTHYILKKGTSLYITNSYLPMRRVG